MPIEPGTDLQRAEKIAIGVLMALLLVAVGRNIATSVDPLNFHEEMRILYHFDPGRTNSKDYSGKFLAEFPQPYLYSAVTNAALATGIELGTFHRSLGLFCSLLFISGGALAGWRIGGALAAVVAAVLFAAQPFYHYQISSATPHAFAFPLLIWGLVLLLYERPYLLAALTVLSGFLYPPISPILGLALAWHIIIARRGLAQSNPSRGADLLALAVTAVLSLALLVHQVTPIEGYGATLAPGAKIDIYPENGPDGRHFYGVFHPIAYVLASAVGQFHSSIPVLAIIYLPIGFAAVAGLGLYYLRNHRALLRPVLSFIVPSAAFCVLITLLKPYIAYRFLLYPLFTVLPLLFVCGLFTLCYEHRSSLRIPAAVVVAIVAPLVLAFSGAEGHRNFAPLRLGADSDQLMAYLRELPHDTLVAAWPPGVDTSLIPYAAGVPTMVNYKAHYPTYEGYVLNMRARMFDLIDAYLAESETQVAKLRCKWQVDYLVVDRSHYSGGGVTFDYFAPFDDRIEEVFGATEKSRLLLLRPPEYLLVYEVGTFQVLDLRKLTGASDCPDDAEATSP